jgi:hypothetical protein
MSTIRQAVAREIRRRKQSGYAFAKLMKQKKVHPVTILKWLYSGHRVSVEMAEKVLKVLDLVIVPRSVFKTNGKVKKK